MKNKKKKNKILKLSGNRFVMYRVVNGKAELLEVDKNGTPIGVHAKEKSYSGKSWRRDSSIVEDAVDVATTKEGMATIGGAAAGGWVGSSIGIVALGTGIAGTLPVAAVGGLFGYLAVKAFGNDKKKKK